MRTILLIGHTDLRVFLKIKTSFIWLFVIPIVFIGFMGYAVRGPGDPANIKPTVLVDNQDTNFVAAVFKAELGTHGLNVINPGEHEDAPQRIRIPADFSTRVLGGEQAKIEFSKKEENMSGGGAMVELRLVRALIAINSDLLVAGADGVCSESALRAAQQAPATVRLQASFAGRKPVPAGFSFSLPGNMVMYVMMNLLIFGGVSMTKQREEGIMRRLACQPVTRGQMVAGKIYGLFSLAAVQVAVYLLAGRFLFGVNLGANLPAVLLTMLIYSWVAGSLGVLLGSIIRAEDKVIGLCVLVSMLMGAVGGCWWPLEVVPPALKSAAFCVPTGWAMHALHQLISFGGTFADAAPALGVLLVFGGIANILAARFFRW